MCGKRGNCRLGVWWDVRPARHPHPHARQGGSGAGGWFRSLCLCRQSRPHLSHPRGSTLGRRVPLRRAPCKPVSRRHVPGAVGFPAKTGPGDSLRPACAEHPGPRGRVSRSRCLEALHARTSPWSPQGVQVSLLWKRGVPRAGWDRHETEVVLWAPCRSALWPGTSCFASGASAPPSVKWNHSAGLALTVTERSL